MVADSFQCVDCKQTKSIPKGVGGTGYARTDDGLVCYACCAIRDKKYMRDNGRHDGLYLVLSPPEEGEKGSKKWEVTNWPGTLRFRVLRIRTSDHAAFGRILKDGRSDVWFAFDGYVWHGVNIGDQQICRCKKTSRTSVINV
jgi:hypothetical protein